LYSVVPRSSQWPSISTRADGLVFNQAAFSRKVARACSLNSYLSKAKKTSLSGPDSGVLPWRCASKLEPDAGPWDIEVLVLDFDGAFGDKEEAAEEETCGPVLSVVLDAQPNTDKVATATARPIQLHLKFVNISTSLLPWNNWVRILCGTHAIVICNRFKCQTKGVLLRANYPIRTTRANVIAALIMPKPALPLVGLLGESLLCRFAIKRNFLR
jgi:hypothetical protein